MRITERNSFGGFGQLVARARRMPGRASSSSILNSRFSIRNCRGFTLIELLVVLSLIIVLASMALVQYRTSVVRSREAVLKEDLFRMRDAMDQYYADKGHYPPALEALVSEGYLRNIPKDPLTDSTATWQSIPAEPDPNNMAAEPGVSDVKSGSEAIALDGSRYADW